VKRKNLVRDRFGTFSGNLKHSLAGLSVIGSAVDGGAEGALAIGAGIHSSLFTDCTSALSVAISFSLSMAHILAKSFTKSA